MRAGAGRGRRARDLSRARSRELEEVAAEIRAAGGEAFVVDLDLASPIPSRKLSQSRQGFGRIDILVNNAGVTRDGLALRMKKDDWDAVLATNLTGAFLAMQQVLPGMMKERWGRIINISSVVGETGNPGQANYVASKAGLIGLTKSLAQEIASRNITVNAVAPGLHRDRHDRQAAAGVEGQHAGVTFRSSVRGKPEDVAAAVRFWQATKPATSPGTS